MVVYGGCLRCFKFFEVADGCWGGWWCLFKGDASGCL